MSKIALRLMKSVVLLEVEKRSRESFMLVVVVKKMFCKVEVRTCVQLQVTVTCRRV